MGGFLKYIKKRFGKGFTFLIIPNSYGPVKSISIPFPLIIVIVLIILFNIFVFAGFTTQIWQIYHFRQELWAKDLKISRLMREQKEVQPTLKRSYQIAEELNRLKDERARILSAWRAVQRKGGRLGTSVSRGVLLRTPPYELKRESLGQEHYGSSLVELDKNLDQLEIFIEREKKADEALLKELLAYNVKLDHMPSKWPVLTHTITSWFGNRFHPQYRQYRMHTGVDIKADYGSKVYAAGDGVVVFTGYRGGYGYTVVIDHGYGYQTLYAHNSKIVAKEGMRVSKGDLICYSGNSGTSTGPHLHYEVLINGKPVNPVSFLKN